MLVYLLCLLLTLIVEFGKEKAGLQILILGTFGLQICKVGLYGIENVFVVISVVNFYI